MAITSAMLRKIRANRQKEQIGRETINQVEHVRSAGARLVMSGALVAGDVVTDDVSAAGVFVGAGSILRIEATADTYVAFGNSAAMAAVDSSTSPAIKLPADYSLVVATDDFVRASAAFTRLEVITE